MDLSNLAPESAGAPEENRFERNIDVKSEEDDFNGAFENETEPRKEGRMLESEDAYAKIVSQIKSDDSQVFDDSVPEDAEAVSKKTDAESQVQHLVDIASTKGVFYAVKVARHFEDNYILDAFHDKLLAEDLHEALVQKGLIEEI